MNLTQQLGEILGAEYVTEDPPLAVDDCRPLVVVAPPSREAVAEVLNFADSAGLKVLPYGAGTRLHIGHPPEKIDIALCTTGLNQLIDYEPADLTAVAGAGLSLFDFYEATSRQGQWLPLDPPGGSQSTLGGVIAANAYGPLRAHYGSARDHVIGLKVITADGTLIKAGGRVVKNVAGYDLTKLFVGSFGTLGVIVEVACKLRPVPEAEKTCLLTSESLVPLAATLSGLTRSELLPISVELLDAQALSQCAVAPGTAGWGLLVRFGESAEAVAYQAERLGRLSSDRPGVSFTPLDDGSAARVWQTVGEFEAQFGTEVTLRLGALPAQTASVVETCNRLLQPCGPRFAMLAHAANGVVRVFIKSVGESASVQQRVAQSIAELRATIGRQGNLVLERAPSALKEELGVWGDAAETAPLMRGLKEKFDPKRTLNPGRFVAGI